MAITPITQHLTPNTKYGRIGVLMGGPSSEREISLKSGKAVYQGLKSAGIDAVAIDIKTEGVGENSRLLEASGIDCAFLALHGWFGEDGQIQAILEELKIPYTGSGPQASRMAMDKAASRKAFLKVNLNIPRAEILEKGDQRAKNFNFQHLGLPLVVKPVSQGSSVGLSIIDQTNQLLSALDLAFQYDEKVLLEEYIPGRELTVGILNEEPLPLIEIIPKNRFFDFQAKYQSGMSEYIVPASVILETAKLVQEKALLAHKILGCCDFSRVDIILRQDNTPFVLEVNTIPGFTETSLLPKAARARGIDFAGLCVRLIELAYEKA